MFCHFWSWTIRDCATSTPALEHLELCLLHKLHPGLWGMGDPMERGVHLSQTFCHLCWASLWVRFSGTSQLPADPQWLQSTSKPSWVYPSPKLLIYRAGRKLKSCFKSLRVEDDLFTANWYNTVVIHMTTKRPVFLAKSINTSISSSSLPPSPTLVSSLGLEERPSNCLSFFHLLN